MNKVKKIKELEKENRRLRTLVEGYQFEEHLLLQLAEASDEPNSMEDVKNMIHGMLDDQREEKILLEGYDFVIRTEDFNNQEETCNR